MATADISSTFCIRVQQSAAAAETINVATNRGLKIEKIMIRWLGLEADASTSTVQISRVRSAAAQALFTSAIKGNRQVVPVEEADTSFYNTILVHAEQRATFLDTDSLRVVTVGAATQVELTFFCIAESPAGLVVT